MSILPSTKSVGDKGEQLVKEYLVGQGLFFVSSNFHTSYGEIDLIFRDRNHLYFIEVKTRGTTSYGFPEEFVDSKKLERIKKSISVFLSNHNRFNSFEKEILIAAVILKQDLPPDIGIITLC